MTGKERQPVIEGAIAWAVAEESRQELKETGQNIRGSATPTRMVGATPLLIGIGPASPASSAPGQSGHGARGSPWV